MIISVPATSANLGPGFDALGVALNLRNRVEIKYSKFYSLSVKGEGASFLKKKEGNIFLRIFDELYQSLTNRTDTFRFAFFNNIPISRGLGSSSAIIVSAVAAAYEAAKVNISREDIVNVALRYENHPDNISPAAHGGFVSSILHDSKVISLKHDMPKFMKAVVAIPDKPISTKASRSVLPASVPLETAVYNISHSSLLAASIVKGDFEMLKFASKDKIHQEIRMNNLPELFNLQKIALESGALMSTLSGSGSSFFNMTYRCDARYLRKTLMNKFPQYRIEILDFDNKGLIIEHH
ncbi:MAG: homoserine kinase [Campylobacterota bacterium]|nr:homoserine kinase [Campylobacterota bacterium]